MAPPPLVVASRLHWSNHARDTPIDAEKALAQVRAFCLRAATYGDAVVLALGLPSPLGPSDVFAESVLAFAKKLHDEVSARSWIARSDDEPKDKVADAHASNAQVAVRLVPMAFWGQFVPALNAVVATAASEFPDATHILFQSLEVHVPASGVAHLRRAFQDGHDLVVGAALPGHAFAPHAPQPLALDGLSTPWNTLALWDLRALAKVGFPLVGDGLGLPTGAAGVEEVATVALYQRLFPGRARAQLVAVPGLEWRVQHADLADPERRAWQVRKMESKRARAAQQLAHLALADAAGPVVFHHDHLAPDDH